MTMTMTASNCGGRRRWLWGGEETTSVSVIRRPRVRVRETIKRVEAGEGMIKKKVEGERERDEGNAQTRKVRDSLRGTMRGELIKINIYACTRCSRMGWTRELGIIREETERWSRGIFAISPPNAAFFSPTYPRRESASNNKGRIISRAMPMD